MSSVRPTAASMGPPSEPRPPMATQRMTSVANTGENTSGATTPAAAAIKQPATAANTAEATNINRRCWTCDIRTPARAIRSSRSPRAPSRIGSDKAAKPHPEAQRGLSRRRTGRDRAAQIECVPRKLEGQSRNTQQARVSTCHRLPACCKLLRDNQHCHTENGKEMQPHPCIQQEVTENGRCDGSKASEKSDERRLPKLDSSHGEAVCSNAEEGRVAQRQNTGTPHSKS